MFFSGRRLRSEPEYSLTGNLGILRTIAMMGCCCGQDHTYVMGIFSKMFTHRSRNTPPATKVPEIVGH